MPTPGSITTHAALALQPIITLCQSGTPGPKNPAMKASLTELSQYLAALAAQLAAQAAQL